MKARPDAHIRNWEGTLWQQGISPADRKVWKDKRVGDAVFYSPRDVFDELVRELKKPCPVKCDQWGRGPACKCNAILTTAVLAVRKAPGNYSREFPRVRLRFHPYPVTLVRTTEAAAIIRKATRPMAALHNVDAYAVRNFQRNDPPPQPHESPPISGERRPGQRR